MTIKNASILLLGLLGAATIFLAAEAIRPMTIGPDTIRSAAIVELCKKTTYPDLCETSVKHGDPFRAAESNINLTIHAARQAKDVASKNSNPKNKELIDGCISFFDDSIDGLVQSLQFLKAKDINSLKSYLSASIANVGTCKDQFDEMEGIPFPQPLAQVCTTLSHMSGNSLALTDFVH